MNSENKAAQNIPLCVDLDGTLVKIDSAMEGLTAALSKNPLIIIRALGWLAKGKQVLKDELSKLIDIEPEYLPYNQAVLERIQIEKDKGRKIILVTGAAKRIADSVFKHFGNTFDEVWSSDETRNLTAKNKRDELVQRYGQGGFDYLGNSHEDILVFEAANEAIVVDPDSTASAWQKKTGTELLSKRDSKMRRSLEAIRPHQWLKNALIFIPVLLSAKLLDPSYMVPAIFAVIAFSAMASAVYVLNDLADIANDRKHPRKKFRPLASGELLIPDALKLIIVLVAIGILISVLFLPPAFWLVMIVYVATTTAYSFYLKKKMLVDVFALALLYTLRIVAGMAAAQTEESFWLLAFSIFFFLSLALVKRYGELTDAECNITGLTKTIGRGYSEEDYDLISQAGISSAFASTLVLALYIDNETIAGTYDNPLLLWPLCPLVLYTLLRLWMITRRGFMHDDPLMFILKDWRSQVATGIGALLVILAIL